MSRRPRFESLGALSMQHRHTRVRDGAAPSWPRSRSWCLWRQAAAAAVVNRRPGRRGKRPRSSSQTVPTACSGSFRSTGARPTPRGRPPLRFGSRRRRHPAARCPLPPARGCRLRRPALRPARRRPIHRAACERDAGGPRTRGDRRCRVPALADGDHAGRDRPVGREPGRLGDPDGRRRVPDHQVHRLDLRVRSTGRRAAGLLGRGTEPCCGSGTTPHGQGNTRRPAADRHPVDPRPISEAQPGRGTQARAGTVDRPGGDRLRPNARPTCPGPRAHYRHPQADPHRAVGAVPRAGHHISPRARSDPAGAGRDGSRCGRAVARRRPATLSSRVSTSRCSPSSGRTTGSFPRGAAQRPTAATSRRRETGT